MTWLIYKHTSPSGKSYIGQTIHTMDYRWKRHVKGALNAHIITKFVRAIRKYGPENFTHEILEENISTQELANEREQYWIAHFNTFLGEGYNETSGGGQCIRSKETRLRQSKAMKGKFLGKKISEEIKQKISTATKNAMSKNNVKQHISTMLTGRKLSEEHKANMSISRNQPENIQKQRESHLGKITSEETKQKISAALTNKQHSDEHNEHVKAALNLPEVKKKCSVAAIKSWNDPIQREQRIQSMKQAWIKRRLKNQAASDSETISE